MNFQVPQFIEQKPKIVGPLTLSQFLYVAGAGALSFLSFYAFNFFLWVMISIVLFALAIALAFVKTNGQDLPNVLLSAFHYFWKPRTYIWQRATLQTTIDTETLEKIEAARERMGIQEKLKSIALSVTTTKLFSPKRFEADEERYERVMMLSGEHKLAKRIDY